MLGELETKEDTKEGQRWAVRIHKYLSIHLKIDSATEKNRCALINASSKCIESA